MEKLGTRRLKFEILAQGIAVEPSCEAWLTADAPGGRLTPADYASTSGLILRLDGEVWVNAPIARHNPNFVDSPPFTLGFGIDGLRLEGSGFASRVEVWLPPSYHAEVAPNGRPWNDYIITHGDRARLAPIGGCAMACKFCNIPYSDQYLVKPVELLMDAVSVALSDDRQPARHLLISGGTPMPEDVPHLRDVYRKVLERFDGLEVDIMMAPVNGLFDLGELRNLGLHQLSINLEVNEPALARTLMPHKYRHGIDHYLAFIERAVEVLGTGRVRSMLMVGLEPLESTLEGVAKLVQIGAIPVLSPFRPDPSTPLRGLAPPTAAMLEEAWAEASAIAVAAGVSLGPECGPCTHNTLTFSEGLSSADHLAPRLVGAR